MPKLTLYHAAPSRSAMVHWLLEEIGEPYEVHLLHLRRGENREPRYLAVNPMGKVPAIRHGDVVVTESAAICLYLADAFPAAGVSVPIGDPRRGVFLKWLFFGPGVLEPAVTDQAFKRIDAPPRGTLGYGDFDTTLDVLAKAL
ncbi:MAG TPA: glutathione S-transferase, partial [Beijerinckiaceae bacterium]